MTKETPAYAFAVQRFDRAREVLANRLSTPTRQLVDALRVLAPLDSRDVPPGVYTIYERLTTLIGANHLADGNALDGLELAVTTMDPGRVQCAIGLLADAASALDRDMAGPHR